MPPLSPLSKSALTLAIGQAVAMSSAQAATIFVDDFSDNGTADTCTLRQAIASANTDNAGNSSCVAGSGDDVIRFGNSSPQTIGLTQGALSIVSNIEILGPKHRPIVIDGSDNGFSQHNFLIASGEVVLDHLSIEQARYNGIYLNNATLTVSNTSVSGSTESGISTFSNSNLTVERSTVSSNRRGITTEDSNLTMAFSTISQNSGGSGAAGLQFIELSTPKSLTISNSTITGNSAIRGSAGLYTYKGSVHLQDNIISGNISENATLIGSEIYLNGPTSVTSQTNVLGSSASSSSQAFYGFTPSGIDIVATSDGQNIALNQILDTNLSDNGGPTPTHNLVAGSPALSRTSVCGQADQRNEPRRDTNFCDLGAVEFLPIGQTITVTNAASPDAGNSTCSLADAITVATTNQSIEGCENGGVNDVISFADGIDMVTLTQALPTITSDVLMMGGNGVTVDARFVNNARVLAVDNGAKVTIDNMTLTGGNVNGDGAGLSVVAESDVTLTNSTITGNNSTGLRGGGGMFVTSYSTAKISNSTLSNNTAVNNSSAAGRGGGILVTATSKVEIEESTVSGNSAYSGGGVSVQYEGALATISNSTISANTATFNGAGVSVAFSGSEANISNSTIVDNNIIPGRTGGVVVQTGRANIQNSVLSNSAFELTTLASGTISTNNNIIGNNTKTTGAALYNVTADSSDILVTSDSPQPTAASAIFGPLSNNGGATLTHALVANSPAINAANNAACPASDQRGESRSDGQCDIGAFEFKEEEACFVVKAANGNVINFCL